MVPDLNASLLRNWCKFLSATFPPKLPIFAAKSRSFLHSSVPLLRSKYVRGKLWKKVTWNFGWFLSETNHGILVFFANFSCLPMRCVHSQDIIYRGVQKQHHLLRAPAQHLHNFAGCMTHIVREFCAEYLRGICARFTPDAHVTSANPTQTLRAPAARGAPNKGCYFWTTLLPRFLFLPQTKH
jgi:hypothetical protein